MFYANEDFTHKKFNEPAVAIQHNETETSSDLRAALIRIWLTAGITLCLAAPAAKAKSTISATPNPVVVVTKGQTQGTTTVTWNAGADKPYAKVWVSVDGGAETLFANTYKGAKAATIQVGKTHTFKLWNSTKQYVWASVSVTAKHFLVY